MLKKIFKIFNITPQRFNSEEEFVRAKIACMFIVSIYSIDLYFPIFLAFYKNYFAAVGLFAIATPFVVYAHYYLMREGASSRVVNASVLSTLLAAFYTTFFVGGILSPGVTVMLVLTTVQAYLLGGKRKGIFWTKVALLFLISITTYQAAGLPMAFMFPFQFNSKESTVVAGVILFGFGVANSYMIYLFETIRSRAYQKTLVAKKKSMISIGLFQAFLTTCNWQ